MYPWVNRVLKVPFEKATDVHTDDNGIPLHGLYVNSPRKATVFPISSERIGIEMIPEAAFKDAPHFTETFILSKGKLEVSIKVHAGS